MGTATLLCSHSPSPFNPPRPALHAGTLSQPERCIQLSIRVEPSKPLHGWKREMERERSLPSIPRLNDELLGGGKGDFTVNVACLAESFFKLQLLEYS